MPPVVLRHPGTPRELALRARSRTMVARCAARRRQMDMEWLWSLDGLLRYGGIDFVGMALTFVSLLLLTRRRRLGFLLGALANAAWLAFGIQSRSGACVLANVLFGLMNLYAWWRWRQVELSAPPAG